MKKLSIVLLILLTLVGCHKNNDIIYQNNVILESKQVDMSIYPNIDFINHRFKAVSMEESLRLVEEKGTGVILYAQPKCNFCRMVTPIVNDVATDLNIDVYYVDVNNKYDEDVYNHLLDIYDEYVELDNGKPVLFIPQIFVIKDGLVVGQNLGFLSEWEGGSLTDEQYDKFYNLVKDLFYKLRD